MSIEVQNITKSFGNFLALNDVSLYIKTGELVALLGPSGSGKTTLLRIIAGLEEADEGSGPILFNNHNMEIPRSRPRRGFRLSALRTFPPHDGFRKRRVRSARSSASDSARQREIRRKVLRTPASGTARHAGGPLSAPAFRRSAQRVALARALAVEPQVLLLDEPFGALDAKVRIELRHWLRRLHDEIHLTSVFVTHDQDEALELADRVAVMSAGKVEQFATPNDVFHKPATEFVMNFLGSVNKFRGQIKDGKVRLGGQYIMDAPGDTDEAKLFVRPHELLISHTKTPNCFNLRALVKRIHSAGARVQVELETHSGDLMTAEMTHANLSELNLETGQEVYVTPCNIHVFGADEHALDESAPNESFPE